MLWTGGPLVRRVLCSAATTSLRSNSSVVGANSASLAAGVQLQQTEAMTPVLSRQRARVGVGGGKRRSGVQREVLSLYKELLVVARRKDSHTVDLVREKFRAEAASVTRFEFQKIEHLIRKGRKYVKLLSADSVKRVAA
jgi:site-specific recombinase